MNLKEALAKFQELKDFREETVALNLEATKREDAELQINPRVRARLDRKRVDAVKYLERQNAIALGVDLDRLSHLSYTAAETASWNKRQAKRSKQTDPGFTDYHQLSARKYRRKMEQLDPTKISHLTPEEAKHKMIEELRDDEAKRAMFSRRRRFVEEEDVTYINQRNYKFNKKLERAYDKYTEELRDNLERGTAL